MRDFEVVDLTDGWSGQAASLEAALKLRDELLDDYPDNEFIVTARVDEEDL